MLASSLCPPTGWWLFSKAMDGWSPKGAFFNTSSFGVFPLVSTELFLTPHTQAVPQKEAAPWRPHHTTFSSGSWLKISDAIGDKRVVSWCITGQDVVPACARQPSETKCLLRSPPGASERLFQNRLKFWVNLRPSPLRTVCDKQEAIDSLLYFCSSNSCWPNRLASLGAF